MEGDFDQVIKLAMTTFIASFFLFNNQPAVLVRGNS